VQNLFTNSAQVILGWSPQPLVLAPGECKQLNFKVSIQDFSVMMTEFVLNGGNCEKHFSVNLDWERCIDTNCSSSKIEYTYDGELSSQYQTAYFEFLIRTPNGTSDVLSLWTTPPLVYDYTYTNPNINGIFMFSYGEITQLAAAGKDICIHAILCVDGNLCHFEDCIPAVFFLQQIPRERNTKTVINRQEEQPNQEPKNNWIKEELKLVPNPAQNAVRVEGSVSSDITEIVIIDLTGKQVKTIQNSAQFEVGELAPGSYLVRVTNKTKEVKYLKLIKQ
jgi:hypothetical protein